MKTGIELIAEERQEQIEKHGLTIKHDVQSNSDGELIEAMMLIISNLAFNRVGLKMPQDAFDDLRPANWSTIILMRILNKTSVEQLKILGAFAAAEIDRQHALSQ